MAEPELLDGRYEIVRTLSEGTRSSVYQALDTVHGRTVALKVHPVGDVADEDFLSEGRVLNNLAPHRGLPEFRGDFFVDDPRRYVVVLKWVEGTNLQDVLDDDGDPGLPLPEVLNALEQVAEALDHLHAQEPPVVHGDVKPENLVRAEGGRVVLVDFDIAAAAHADHDRDADRYGTAGFVAPEVKAGEKAGPPADVHGLAVTAMTLLNGPFESQPTYPGLAPAVQAQVARVLRTGIASDPTRRPKPASRLIANLRAAADAAPPSGVVALLAWEIADAGRLWEDAEGMRTAMGRLSEVVNDVMRETSGWVVSSMNEADRTIAVFTEGSSAAKAALRLHDAIATLALPRGIDIRLRCGLAIGEAELINGMYVGAVVDQVVRLRSAAEPDTTLMSEATAELLVGLVGGDVAIVPLGTIDRAGVNGARVFALQRPADEVIVEPEGADRPVDTAVAADHSATRDPVPAPLLPPAAPHPGPRPRLAIGSRQELLADAWRALQRTTLLVPATAAGIAGIYALVLAGELGGAALAWVATGASGLVAVSALARDLIAAARPRQRAAQSRWEREVRYFAARGRLRERLADLPTTADIQLGIDVLGRLRTELQAVTAMLQAQDDALVRELLEDVPALAANTYEHGVAALIDAVQLLEIADDPDLTRVEVELAGIDRRVEDPSLDEQERAWHARRGSFLRDLPRRREEAHERARGLLLEASRCATALADVRLGLASIRHQGTRPKLDQVVAPLEDSIVRVRAVQDELREIGF